MKTKLAGHLPLQDAIARTIDEAREKMKLAAEEREEKTEKKDEKKKAPPFAKKEEKEECAEKTSSIIDPQDAEEVEKLAAALDEMAEKIADYHEMGGESHQGGETLAVQSPTGGTQPYKKDKSKSHNVPTSTGMISTKDNPGAKTAVPTDDHRAPGGNGARYPAKGVLKTGSVSVLQNALAEMTGVEAEEKTAGRVGDAAGKVKDFFKGRPKAWGEARRMVGEAKSGKGIFEAIGAPNAGNKMTAMNRLKTLGGAAKAVAPELAAGTAAIGAGAYGAKKLHDKKQGKKKTSGAIPGEQVVRHRLGGSEHANEERGTQKGRQYGAAIGTGAGAAMAGVGAHQGQKVLHGLLAGASGKKANMIRAALPSGAGRHALTGAAALLGAGAGGLLGRGVGGSVGRSVGVMRGPPAEGKKKKSAVDYILAKISAVENGGESRQGGEQLDNDAPIPSNAGRELIRNKDGIKNVTKAQAKSPRKKELAEVLTEPAMSAAHDSKVNENLRNASKGGVKIAAARAFLQKIAEEGCQCEGAGECRHCKMHQKTAALRGNGTETEVSVA